MTAPHPRGPRRDRRKRIGRAWWTNKHTIIGNPADGQPPLFRKVAPQGLTEREAKRFMRADAYGLARVGRGILGYPFTSR